MTYSLFVRPVTHVSKEFLYSVFSEFGEVKDCYIPKDYKSGRRRTFAYIKYDDKFSAAKAIEMMDQKEVNGRVISVGWSQEISKTPEEMEAINTQKAIQRQERAKNPKYTPEEHELFLKKKNFAKGEFHDKFFSAVDYPLGVGEEFTPIFQRGLKPVGERKTFFHWQYIPEEKIRQIIEQEVAYQNKLKGITPNQDPQ